uniref:Fibritin neck whisker n=1 Tax=Acinetobacter phage vB_AbaSt_W16 TaxID=3116434 RepID=A0AB38ZCX1_9CAUD
MTTKVDFLPYVDGIPTDGQHRLSWIRNGDLLNGSDTKYGNEGNLNAFGVELQKNIVFLAENIDVLESNANITQEELEKIKEILGEVGTGSIVEKVNANTENIELINKTVETLTTSFNESKLILNQAVTDIGIRTELNGPNNIFTDLGFIKSRIGNNENEDISGLPSDGNPASGIILKILDQGKQINKNLSDLEELNTKFNDSDISGLSQNIDKLRLELGQSPEPNTPTVYARLNTLESSDKSVKEHLDEIDNKIGSGNISEKVEINTGELNTLKDSINNPETGIKKSIEDLKQNQDTLLTDLAKTNESLENVATKSNTNETNIGTLNDTVGINNDGPNTLLQRTANLETVQQNQTTTIQDMEVILGTSTTGLQGDVQNLKKALDGDSSASDPVAQAGLKAISSALIDKTNALQETQDRIVAAGAFSSKSFVLLGDATTNVVASDIAKVSLVRALPLMTKGVNGANSISILPDYVSAKSADVILVNIGTYDYLFDRELGTLADAKDGTEADTFYADVYKLFADLTAGTSRVLTCTGFRSKGFKDSVVSYPNNNGVNTSYDKYVLAVTEVADIFGIPVIPTHHELGISAKNIDLFANSDGLTKLGIDRFSILVAQSLR